MPRGQKPKPSQIKELEGNRRKVGRDKIPQNPQGRGNPTVPMHLNAEERQLWALVAHSLPDGLLSRADDAILERFAVAWACFREANRKIAATGLMVQSPQGPVRNPLLVVRNNSAKEMHAAGGEIGLSPVARARLAATEQGDDDPLALLLGMDGDAEGAWSTVPPNKRN